MSIAFTTLDWALDVDPDEWLYVPREPEADWHAETTDRVLATLRAHPDNAGHNGVRETELLSAMAAASAQRLQDFVRAMDASNVVVAALGVEGRTPVPALVTVAMIDEDDPVDLMEVCGAVQGHSFDAPDVEYLEFPDADGIRVTRTDVDPDGLVWMTICLGVRTSVADVVIRWRTTDLEIVPEMADRLSTLLGAVTIWPSTDSQETT